MARSRVRDGRVRLTGVVVLLLALAGAVTAPGPASAGPAKVTGIAVQCSPDPVVETHATRCTVVVSGEARIGLALQRPSGTVRFTSAAGQFTPAVCVLATVRNTGPLVARSTCSVSYSPSGAGSNDRRDTVTASYSGNLAYAPATGTGSVAVLSRVQPTAVTVACTPDPVPVNSPTSCTITVAGDAVGTDGQPLFPSGTVSLSGPGGFAAGRCVLARDLAASGSDGSASSCRISYAPTGSVLTGSGGSGADGRQDTLTASYGGDANYAPATGFGTVGVTTQTKVPVQSISVGCNPDPVVVGSQTVCTVTVTGDGAGYGPVPAPPLGTVTVSGSGGTLAPTTCALAYDSAASSRTVTATSCAVTYTPTGSGSNDRQDTLTASYAGDAVYQPATGSGTVAVVAVPAPTPVNGVSVSCSPDPVVQNTPTTCTVRVSGSSPYGPLGAETAVPVGTVTVSGSNGAVTPATCALAFAGATTRDSTSSCSVVYTPSGSGSADRRDTLTASYSGGGPYGPATGSGTVAVAPKPAVAISVTCNPDPVREGTPTTCTVALDGGVKNGAFPVAPFGTVSFTAPDGTLAPTSCVLGNRTVGFNDASSSCSVSYLPKGPGTADRRDTLTVSYSGDGTYAPGTGSGSVAVLPRAEVAMSVTCNPDPVVEQSSTTCTASVSGNVATAAVVPVTPVGTVTFAGGQGSFAPSSCTLTYDRAQSNAGTSTASCSVRYTPAGAGATDRRDTVTASYDGDPVYAPATATGTVAVTPRAAVSGISVNCTPDPVIEGNTTTCTVIVAGGSSGPFSLPANPVGTVTIDAPDGTASPSSCSLRYDSAASTPTSDASSCTFSYTPAGPATADRRDPLTVSYQGDRTYAPATGSGSVAVFPATS